jgi:hypothetical protein
VADLAAAAGSAAALADLAEGAAVAVAAEVDGNLTRFLVLWF